MLAAPYDQNATIGSDIMDHRLCYDCKQKRAVEEGLCRNCIEPKFLDEYAY